jgi:U3 small nucleolar RNA-associated protein 11
VLERNPDEFYFGMMSQKGPSAGKNQNGTLNGDRGSQVLSQDAMRLFTTQDLGYVRTMRNKTQKEVDVLKTRVVGIKGEGKKIVYVDDEGEQMDRVGEEDDDEDQEDEDEDEDEDVKPEDRRLRKMQSRELDKLENRLEDAQRRQATLAEAEEALELKKARMAKSPTVGGITKKGIKFRVRERKR